MKAVFVEHPKFKAELLHISELPESVVFGEKPEGFGLMDTVSEVFRVGLTSPGDFDKFENLTTGEALQCWRLYTAAKAYERGFFHV
jgi:hypothetical protein